MFLSGRLFGVGLLLAVTPAGLAQEAKEPAKKIRRDGYGDPLPEGAIVRLGTPRLHHAGVFSMTFAPDSKRLATVSGPGFVRLWDIRTGEAVRQWRVPQYFSYSPSWSPVAFSPNSRYLAMACYDKTTRIFDTSDGRETLKEGSDFVNAVAFSPDGKSLGIVTGNRVRIINPETGALRHELEGCKHVNHVGFSEDGKTVVAVGHDQPDRKLFCIYHWDAASGQQTDDHFFEFPSGYASRLSPNGKYLVVPEPKGTALTIWDTGTGKQIAKTEGPAGYLAYVGFAGDSKTLTALSREGQVRIWQTATAKLVRQFAASTGELGRVALSADGQLAATMSRRDDGIHLWKVATGKELHHFPGHRHGPLAVAFAADGKSVLTTSRDGGFSTPPRPGADWSLRRWDFHTGKEVDVWRQEQDTEVRHAIFSPSGRFLATANNASVLRFLDCTNGKQVRAWDLPTRVTILQTGKDVKKYPNLAVEQLVFSADGAMIAAPSPGKISLYDAATGKRLREIARPEEAIARCCFFPDGKSLLVADGTLPKHSLSRVDAETGMAVRTFDKKNGWANVLAVSADGRLAARLTGAALEMFEATTGELRWSGRLGDWGFALGFSADSRLVATGGRDATVRVWDAASGRQLRQWTGDDGEVTSLAFSADSRWLVSGGGNTALVWDLQSLAGDKQTPPP